MGQLEIHPSHTLATKLLPGVRQKYLAVYCTTCRFWLAWKARNDPEDRPYREGQPFARERCRGRPSGPA